MVGCGIRFGVREREVIVLILVVEEVCVVNCGVIVEVFRLFDFGL